MERSMRDRRDFLKTVAGATTGMLLTGSTSAESAPQAGAAAPGKRREVFIGGRRVKVVDVHAHCLIPEVWDIVKDTKFGSIAGREPRKLLLMGPDRIQWLDEHGIDVQLLTINPFWYYGAERELAARIVRLQDEKVAEWCGSHADRH